MPKAKQPLLLKTDLLSYQLQGLQYLIDAERPKLPTAKSAAPVQFWELHDDGKYVNLIDEVVSDEPELCKGAILADDMGLGKTLQFLSLVLHDRNSQPIEGTSKTSLVVCPLSIIDNWVKQAEEHIKEEADFTIYVAHGSNRNMKKSHLEKFDMVVTTYNVLALYAGMIWLPIKTPCR
jgi:SWI/SNF-related matrix-associated actin-dependent regulator of chromatin subfamily A3